jgi:DNA processing protein
MGRALHRTTRYSTRGAAMMGGDAWLALGIVPGLTPRAAFELCRRLGGPGAVLGASVETLAAHGLGTRVAERVGEASALARRERARVARANAEIVTWDSPAYPARLRTIVDPPLALFVRGALTDPDEAVAIVGARRAGEYGRRAAHALASGLAQAGVVVVSGLAAGVDGAAHRGALEGGGRTVAVMATGIDEVYPAWHRDLAREIAGHGALVTEFPVGTRALPQHFPQRNRIVSGLAAGVVVIEAADGSGSLITARYALEQGREVLAVPGPIGDGRHRGSHRLLRQGATLVTGVEDVLEVLAPALLARLADGRARAALACLSEDERGVLDAVGDEGAHVDEISLRARRTAAASLEILLALELRGVVEQRPGARFLRRRAA